MLQKYWQFPRDPKMLFLFQNHIVALVVALIAVVACGSGCCCCCHKASRFPLMEFINLKNMEGVSYMHFARVCMCICMCICASQVQMCLCVYARTVFVHYLHWFYDRFYLRVLPTSINTSTCYSGCFYVLMNMYVRNIFIVI